MGKDTKNTKNGDVVLKPLRLLIVEDSQNDADLILHELKRGGFDVKWKRVQTGRDMESALDTESWDMVISDFKMPNFTGLDALHVLQKNNLDIPFIISSGTIGEETAVAIMKAGASDYIMKDNLSRLPSAVERELRDAEGRKARKQADESLRISNEWLRIAQKAAKSAFWNWDMVSDKLRWSEEFYELFGLPPETEASFDTWKKVLHPDDLEMAMAAINRAIKEKTYLENEYRIILPDRTERWIAAKGNTSYDDTGKPLRMSGICIDITERKKIENTQLFLLQSGITSSGENFFRSLAVHLAETLGMDYVCIDRLSGDRLSAQTVANYNNSKFDDNIEYSLKDTPCGDVVGKIVCCFPSGVSRLFPKDEVLKDMEAESYVGTTLWNSKGRPIGLIAVIGKKPLENPAMAESILKIVSLSAAGEMERVEANEKLTKSETLFRTLTKMTPTGIYLTDPTGKCIYANEKWLEMAGMKLEEALDGGWIRAIHPDDRDYVLSNWDKMVESKGKWNLEYRFRTSSGKITTILGLATELCDEKGNITGYVGSNIDITEWKKSEKERMLLSDTISACLNEIYLFDAETLKFKYVNSGALSNLGYSMEKIRNMTPLDIKPEFTIESFRRILDPLLKREKNVLVFETGHRRADSTIYPVEVHLQLFDRGDERVFLAVIQDITERKRLEDRLRQSEKMEAIGQLAGGIAHDFNNQLTGIMGYAEMLALRIDDKNLREYAENIVRASKRSSDLTKDLLAFSRKGKIRSVPVNMHNEIEEVVSILERSIDKRIEIKRILRAVPATVMGDPSQLQNALLNIAINARDAMPEGGELVFTTENLRFQGSPLKDEFPMEEFGHCMKISISDTGKGMDKETIKHIFEPFFTTKEVGKGTGMGLASVYGTVNSHHGLINVCSELGKGSVFTLYFPVTEEKDEKDISEKGKVNLSRKMTIMLVEDEELVRGMVAKVLNSLGHKVIACKDGVEAVEMYRKAWKDIDMIILDMIMPKMSGKDTFRAIKAINPKVKVLLASGYSVDGEAQEILDAGAKGFIQKPFNSKDIERALANVAGKS